MNEKEIIKSVTRNILEVMLETEETKLAINEFAIKKLKGDKGDGDRLNESLAVHAVELSTSIAISMITIDKIKSRLLNL